MDDHLDLEALADVLAGEPAPAHLATCPTCTQALADLTAADALVLADLAALPFPEAPADLDARISRALSAERPTRTAATTITPITESRARRWFPAAGGLAAAAVLVTGGVLLFHNAGSGNSTKSASTAPESATGAHVDIIRAQTGTDYTRSPAALTKDVATLLHSGADVTTSSSKAPQAQTTLAGDSGPLAKLHTTPGLAACLASLSDGTTSSVPLAIDYATFEGKPALIVVLPSTKAGKLDVFALPPSCPTDQTIYDYARIAAP